MIVTEAASGTRRYLLSDGLGSVRQVTDEAGEVVSTHEFDPYGVPLTEPAGDPYGYTGEWWQDDLDLLHLRARWYDPHTGTFLSRDAVESEPPYQYVRGNVVNLTDPSGNAPPPPQQPTPEPRTPEPPPQPTGTPVPDGWEPPTYPTLVPPLPDLNDRLPFPPPDPEPEPEPFQLPPGASLNIEKFDGIVFGGSVSLSGLFYFGDNEVRPFDTNMNYFGLCLPDMGDNVGYDLVYDFKHQERGLFTYESDFNNGLSTTVNVLGDVNLSGYIGRTKGFASPANGYREGIQAYAGKTRGVTNSVSHSTPGFDLAGAGIEVAYVIPLLENDIENHTGVYVHIFGASFEAGGGPSLLGPIPVSADVEFATTSTIMQHRFQYVYNQGDIPPESWWRMTLRAAAAVNMIAELNSIALVQQGTSYPFLAPAVADILYYSDKP